MAATTFSNIGFAGLVIVTLLAGFVGVNMIQAKAPTAQKAQTSTSVVPASAVAPSGYDELTAIQMSEYLCRLADKTGLSSAPCSTDYHTVKMSFDLTISDARQVCSDMAKMSKKQELNFDGKWRLEIRGPYSSGPLAWCVLP